MGKKTEVAGAVSYRIMGLACGDPYSWEEIFAEIDVEPRYAWMVYRELLDSRSKRLEEIGITRKQLESRARSYMNMKRQGNGSSEDGREISEVFRSIFLE